ncbi:MAG: DUF1294 domain-containing protein [Clostridia bacterium]
MHTKTFIIIYILLINTIAFFAMKKDKQYAINHDMRISEKTLFTLALFLGAPGIYGGMYAFRHKTKHMSFKIFIPICIILNLLCLYYLLYKMMPMIGLI